ILEGAHGFVAALLQIAEDDADSLDAGRDLLSRPSRQRRQLGGGIFRSDNRDVACRLRIRIELDVSAGYTPTIDEPTHRWRHAVEPCARHLVRGHECLLVRPCRELRLIDRSKRAAACDEVAAPTFQRTRLGRVEALERLDRDQVFVKTAPTACGKSCRIRWIQQLAREATLGNDIVPKRAALRAAQHALDRRPIACKGARFEVFALEPSGPGQYLRRAPHAETARLSV